jgi:hypothetical protein
LTGLGFRVVGFEIDINNDELLRTILGIIGKIIIITIINY